MIRFRKLWYISDPAIPDEGMIMDAIVAYRRIAIEQQTVALSDEERRKKGYAAEPRPTKWKHWLLVDLWLVRLRFVWLSSI